MHNSVWKLTSLATVVGVALFFIVQAQKLMKPQAEGPGAAVTGTDHPGDDESNPLGEDDEDFPRRTEQTEIADGHSHQGGSHHGDSATEPDPFADEREFSTETVSARYGDQKDEPIASRGHELARGSARPISNRRPTPQKEPTLRLPARSENPFDEDSAEPGNVSLDSTPAASGITSDEGDDVGPRLSLPGRKQLSPESEDLIDGKQTMRESVPSKIRRTSAEEISSDSDEAVGVPTLAASEENEDDAAFSIKRKSNVNENEEAEQTSRLTIELNPESNVETGEQPVDRTSAPSIADDEGDDASFSRQSRRDDSSLESEESASEVTPKLGSRVSKMIEPEFPEAENPMPTPKSVGEEPRLFPIERDGKMDSTRSKLTEDDTELFPEATSGDSRRPQPTPELMGRGPTAVPMTTSEESFSADEEIPAGKPHLSIEKKSPPSATLGEKMIYEIRVSNPGTVPAHQVVLNDDVPEGVDLDGTIPRAELSGRRLIWRFGTIQPGEDRLVKVRVTPVRVGEVGSVATVNFLAESEKLPATKNVPANYQLEAQRSLSRVPQLEISTSNIPQEIGVNGKFRVTLQIRNADRRALKDVVLTAELDEAVRHQEVQETLLECPIGDIEPGQSTTVDLDLIAVKAGMSINRLRLLVDNQPVREAEMNFRVLPTR